MVAILVWPFSALVNVACGHLQESWGWSHQVRNAIELVGFIVIGLFEFYFVGWLIERFLRGTVK